MGILSYLCACLETLRLRPAGDSSGEGDGDELQLDLSRLPAGVYMLRVTMADGSVYSDKVVKE